MSLERYQRSFLFNRIPILHPAIFYDDCEGTFAYIVTADGADFYASYSTANPLVGTNCLHLKTRSTGPQINDEVMITKRLWLPPTQSGRIQLAITPQDNVNDIRIWTSLLWYDGVNLHTAQFSLNGQTKGLYYRDAALNWILVFPNVYRTQALTWTYLDFYVHFLSERYGYVACNNQVADLADIPVLSSPDATPPHLQLNLIVTTLTAARGGAAFDQILLTSETP